MTQPGSHHVAAEIVARALLESGATNLQAKLGAHIASYGDHCWQSDTMVQTLVKRWDGRTYHRESIGRARRLMARAGWIESKRVFPQQKPEGAKYSSTHGTTSKRVLWKTLGLKSPMTRGDRKKRRVEQTKRTSDAREIEPPRMRARVALEPSFVKMIAGIGDAATRTVRRRNERPADRSRYTDDALERKAAEARRLLEQWDRDDNKRGPP